ncbi:MAG: Coq4 family protein, partial [Cyanobacteria bacterium P01_F01_bin.3]
EDEDWLDQRAAVSHDIYHVVTGFDASHLGEYGLAAFSAVQYRDMLNAFVLSFAPVSLLRPDWTLPLLRNLWRGFKLGRQCQPIIGYAFEQNWEKPLSQVRQELGIGGLCLRAQYGVK